MVFSRTVRRLILMFSFPPLGSFAQTSPGPYPPGIVVCETGLACWQWDFTGKQGTGRILVLPDVVQATFTIETLDASSIVIRREDQTGVFAGLTATYSGTRQGNLVSGDVIAQWPGHGLLPSNTWQGILRPPASSIDPNGRPISPLSKAQIAESTGWFVCEDEDNGCTESPRTQYLWVLDEKSGRGRYVADHVAAVELTIDEITTDSIVMRRIDRDGAFKGLTALYRGTRTGTSMKGTVTDIWPGHLNAPKIRNWSARLTPSSCEVPTESPLSYNDSTLTGTVFSMRGDGAAEFSCYLLTAQQGDAFSEAVVGRMLYEGEQVSRNDKEALTWLGKSAKQNNTIALHYLSLMYQDGRGTPPDHLYARYLADQGASLESQKAHEALAAKAVSPLDALGNMLGEGLFGISARSDRLQERLGHESKVLSYMKSGKPRVEAEELVYNTEFANRRSVQTSCIDREMAPSSGFTSTCGRGTDRDCPTRYQAEQTCHQNAYEAEQNNSDEYLVCVRKYVDSEAIEAHCPFLIGSR